MTSSVVGKKYPAFILKEERPLSKLKLLLQMMAHHTGKAQWGWGKAEAVY